MSKHAFSILDGSFTSSVLSPQKACVEFVLAPQHRTSGDPETTTKEDFDYGEESNLEVFRWIHDKSHETKMETRRRIRILTLLEHCHVHLSVVL